MANKNKKELTTKQEYKRARVLQWTSFGGEILTMLAPFVAIAIVNFEEYFIQVDGVKVSLGFFLALGVAGIVIATVSKGKVKEELKNTTYVNTLISIAFVLLIIGLICYLMASILNDLFMICLCGAAGVFVAVFEEKLLVQHFKKKAEIIKEVINEVDNTVKKDKYQQEKEKMLEKAKREKETKGLI